MAKTNTIITIGRQYGSAGREIGYKVADELDIKYMIKRCLTVRQKRAESARNYLRHTMRNQPIVFYILW